MDEAQQFTAQFLAQQALTNPAQADMTRRLEPYLLLEFRRLFRKRHSSEGHLPTQGGGWCHRSRPRSFEPGQRVAVRVAPSEYGMIVEHGQVVSHEHLPDTEWATGREHYTVRLDRGVEVEVQEEDNSTGRLFGEVQAPDGHLGSIVVDGAELPPARVLQDAIRYYRSSQWHLMEWLRMSKGTVKKRSEALEHYGDYQRHRLIAKNLILALETVPVAWCRTDGPRGQSTALYKRLVLIGAESSSAFYAQEYDDLVQLPPSYASQFADWNTLDYRVVDAHKNGLWMREWHVQVDPDDETALINLQPIPLYYCRPTRGWKIPEPDKPQNALMIAWSCLRLDLSFTEIPSALWARVYKQFIQERVPELTVGMDGMRIVLKQVYSQPLPEDRRLLAAETLGSRLEYGNIYSSINLRTPVPLREHTRFAQILCAALKRASYGLNVIGQLYLRGET